MGRPLTMVFPLVYLAYAQLTPRAHGSIHAFRGFPMFSSLFLTARFSRISGLLPHPARDKPDPDFPPFRRRESALPRRWLLPSYRVLPCAAALALAFGCLTSPGCETSKPRRSLETFEDVYRHREANRDSLITLTGRYMGWQGAECVFPSYAAQQKTRSDWIFQIGDSCLYVTGGRPPDLSPMEGTGGGRQIRLDARLRITPDSRLLLEYVRSAPVSP